MDSCLKENAEGTYRLEILKLAQILVCAGMTLGGSQACPGLLHPNDLGAMRGEQLRLLSLLFELGRDRVDTPLASCCGLSLSTDGRLVLSLTAVVGDNR